MGESALPKDTPIFVDSSLRDGVKGEEVSRQLYEQGFTELYLATGYDPSQFGPLPWIRAIRGKSPPDWNFRSTGKP